MESLRLAPVAFCGENPLMILHDPTSGAVKVAASYWRCTYSAHGEGNALLLYLDAENAAALNHPAVTIYADNTDLARFVTTTFNQHFEEWKGHGFTEAAVQQARFIKDSDSRQSYRVACYADQTHIDLLWHDLRGCDFRTFPDLEGGGFGAAGDEHYHVSNVIFLCGAGRLTINQRLALGAPQTRTLSDGRFSSSVFVALSETWVKLVQPTTAQR